METSSASTMVGDYSRSTNSSQNQKFNASTTQKGRRLENIASRLHPNRTSSNTNGTQIKRDANIRTENGSKMECHQCLGQIKTLSEAITCFGCKKYAHISCSSLALTKEDNYVCSSCKKHSIFPGTSVENENEQRTYINTEIGNVEKPTTRRTLTNTLSNTFQAKQVGSTTSTTSIQSRKASISNQKYSNPPTINTDIDVSDLQPQFPTGSSLASSVDDENSVINSEAPSVSSSPSMSTNHSRESPSRIDSPISDNDDSRPSSKMQKSKNNGVKEKRGAARQSSMKTRSGGKPSGLSYAHLGKGGCEKRKPNVKGKGKLANTARPRRQRGPNRMAFLPLPVNSQRESDELNDSDEPKTRQADENDYIRTAIVSSSENLFVCTAPMCLICGGIGKDAEATMMSCMSCCQTYHSYCINMHDKLNKTLMKRGWRCLQCTVCEACGDGADENNLLLCDECDVAFHTYCLEPKLDKVPTGSWRCHWCATCRRCNKQVQAGLDLQRYEGLCEMCYSLKKCLKCNRSYHLGDLMIKCQHCTRWFHGLCEELTNEEQLENAYENDFRCSLCRPRANTDYNDVMNQSVIIDNVMVNKSALEMLKCGRSGSSLSNLGEITGSFRSQSTDQSLLDEDSLIDDLDIVNNRIRGRITGPGRRPPKIGIGGFVVKNRNRAVQSIDEDEKEKEEQEEKQNTQGKQKRRPRKPRRHQLEDAYPFIIQEAFWGRKGVDGKTVVEMHIAEPHLDDRHHFIQEPQKLNEVFELSEQAADALRSQQEQDMIGDMLGDNLDVDIDNLDNFDFSNFLGDDDDDFDDDFTNETPQEQLMDYQQENQNEFRKNDNFSDRKLFEIQKPQIKSDQTHNSEKSTVQRWAEDEPLGDKANTAPVLYANLFYPNLKTDYPNWADRAKHVHRIWRSLDADSRSMYVKKAKENRTTRTRAPRRRGVNQMNRAGSQAGDLSALQSAGESMDGEEFKQNIEVKPEINGIKVTQQINGTNASSGYPQKLESAIKSEFLSQQNKPRNEHILHVDYRSAQTALMTKQGSHEVINNLSGGGIQQRPQITTEIAQRYDNLKKEQEILKKKHEQIDQDVVSWRKSKKNLSAKRRQLNKNNDVDGNGQKIVHELSEPDQEKFENLTRNIQSHNKELDQIRRQEKEIQGQLDDLEKKYAIVSVTAVPPESQVVFCNESGGQPSQPQSLILREGGSTINLSSPRINLNSRTTSANNFHSILINGNNALQRADSVSSLTEPGTPGSVRSNSAMSGEFPQQSRRGRKRKKDLSRYQRSVVLGGIPYNSLKDDYERQVYDVMDTLLNEICGIDTGNEPDVRKLLMTHAPPDHSSLSPTIDLPKKKKRMTTKKILPANESNEYEAVLERIHSSLTNLPQIPPGALNPFPSFEPSVFITSDTTKLPGNCDILNDESHFGSVGLSFMDDFYDEFESGCTKKNNDHETFIKCSELYSTVRIDALREADTPEIDKIFSEFRHEPYFDLDFPNEVPRDDLDQLNVDNVKDRDVSDAHIPWALRWPDIELPPCDPPRSLWNDLSLAREEYNIELIVDFNEDALTDDVVSQIASILRSDGKCGEDIEYTLDTIPVLSPTNSCPDLDDDILECNGCHAGLMDTNIYEHEIDGEFKERYCSKKCFMEHNNVEKTITPSSRKVDGPLTIDIADKESLIPPLPTPDDDSEDEISLTEADKLILLGTLRQPRELEYNVAELPQPAKPTAEVTPGGSRAFKYRDYGWMIFDEKLMNTFRQESEETQMVMKDYCGNWLELASADMRNCVFCGGVGDGPSGITGRLLNVDANEWVHVNCAIWSTEVYESECGGLNNVQLALVNSKLRKCFICTKNGASIKCFKSECDSWYHMPCAHKNGCKFMKDRTMICVNHGNNIHPDVKVETLSALRRIYIEREENDLLSKIFNNSFSCDMMMRIGSLIFHQVGQLLPDQLKAFHNTNFIFPIGYKVVRIFWHPNKIDKRIPYECHIEDCNNSPQFKITFEDKEIKGSSAEMAWSKIFTSLQQSREKNGSVLRFFPNQVNGDFMFGFYEIPITKIIESLPGIDQLHTYDFKHGGIPIMEVPLAVNPTGCARTEPCFRTLIKAKKSLASPTKPDERPPSSTNGGSKRKRRRPVNGLSNLYDEDTLKMLKASGISEDMLANGKYDSNSAQLYSRYKTMKSEWKSYVQLGRSGIAGFGLYAKKDICMHQMVCEYVGEIIRGEVCEIREKKYSQKNMGIYMFRIDNELVIDATKCGNMARYINHSCDPNCFTQIVNIDNTKKIVIIANRPIKSGEELCYDYQFELEDTKDKIPCLCGAPNCVKWMN